MPRRPDYQIAYGPATLTVNPAPLTIIADNKSMGVGSTVPLLTASYFGLVNGDTPAVVGGSVELTTNATSSSPAGTYAITFANAPALPNYTVTTVPGTLTVNPDLLTFNNNYFVTGDFAVGWVSLRGQGDGSGFATGAISIPNVGLSDPANTVPVGADIVAAYLYWQAVEWSGFAPRGERLLPRLHDHRGASWGATCPSRRCPRLRCRRRCLHGHADVPRERAALPAAGCGWQALAGRAAHGEAARGRRGSDSRSIRERAWS